MEMLLESNEAIETATDFRRRVDIILSTHVSPDNISTYAVDALDGLVGLVGDVVTEFQTVEYGKDVEGGFKNTRPSLDTRTLEDNALIHFGLEGVEYLLDHIYRLDMTLNALPSLIENSEIIKGELFPPQKDITLQTIEEVDDHDDGENGSPRTLEPKPRLETVLFLLAEGYGIDVTDKKQLALSSGEDNSRWKPYYMVQAKGKGLDHIVLVCNAPGNATFVLSRADISRHEVLRDPALFQKITKPNMTELLKAVPTLGAKINYSDNFTIDLITALNGSESTLDADQLLYPIAPEDVKTEAQLNRSWDLGSKSQIVKRAATVLGLYAQKFRFSGIAGPPLYGYGPNGQQRIKQYIDDRTPSDNVLPLNALRKQHGVAYATLGKVAEITEDLFATAEDYPREYLFGMSSMTKGYDERWQGRIAMTLAHLYPPVTPATDEILNIARIAECLHVHRNAVAEAIKELGPRFIASTKVYGFGKGNGVRAVGYTPVQQQALRSKLLTNRRITKEWQFPFETPLAA
jgi:hypothetical protein